MSDEDAVGGMPSVEYRLPPFVVLAMEKLLHMMSSISNRGSRR